MKKFNLKRLLRKKDEAHLLVEMMAMLPTPVAVVTADGELLLGVETPDSSGFAVEPGGDLCGWVRGNAPEAERVALLLTHLAQKEMEKNSLAQDGLEKYREINMLYDISERIFSCMDPADIARLVIAELLKFIRSDNISVMLYNDENETLNILAATDTEFQPKTLLKTGEGIAGSVMVSGRAEIVNNVAADPRYRLGTHTIGSIMCAPLMTRESCLGVINVSRINLKDFAARDLRLVSAIASQTAIAIENALLYENLKNTFYNAAHALAENIEMRDPYSEWTCKKWR